MKSGIGLHRSKSKEEFFTTSHNFYRAHLTHKEMKNLKTSFHEKFPVFCKRKSHRSNKYSRNTSPSKISGQNSLKFPVKKPLTKRVNLLRYSDPQTPTKNPINPCSLYRLSKATPKTTAKCEKRKKPRPAPIQVYHSHSKREIQTPKPKNISLAREKTTCTDPSQFEKLEQRVSSKVPTSLVPKYPQICCSLRPFNSCYNSPGLKFMPEMSPKLGTSIPHKFEPKTPTKLIQRTNCSKILLRQGTFTNLSASLLNNPTSPTNDRKSLEKSIQSVALGNQVLEAKITAKISRIRLLKASLQQEESINLQLQLHFRNVLIQKEIA
ncbi:unnamed protein product [Moneuplotes crassus]|uniref:Uncharacterized protein n=1 Tax=Euplotes crassus TaxID=5936 RepID=A0AAD1U6V4_EUPCR|nr:unnamed protein product [Moneuplotes crassus]